MRGLTYVLRNKLYVALTNQVISASPLQLRGPSFQLPVSANFHPLEAEPTSDDVFKAVDDAFTNGLIGVSSMDSDVITFAGIGEPLLRLDTLYEASSKILEHRHGAQLRVKTNGLVSLKFGSKVCADASFSLASPKFFRIGCVTSMYCFHTVVQFAATLAESGVSNVSVSLTCDNPKQYLDIMKPTNGCTYSDTCNFVVECVEAGEHLFIYECPLTYALN